MLTKQIKSIKSLHGRLFITEKKIAREIGSLQKKAKTDFKKLLRRSRHHSAVRFSSLRENMMTKDWDAVIYVEPLNDSMTEDEFRNFCRYASEKIGVTFEYANDFEVI